MIEGYTPVAKVSDIKPGERKIIHVKGKELGVFNVEGTIQVISNHCPHMGAPICRGPLIKEIQAKNPGEFTFSKRTVLRCPWHRWEFDVLSGESIFDESIRLKTYNVVVNNGVIYCKI